MNTNTYLNMKRTLLNDESKHAVIKEFIKQYNNGEDPSVVINRIFDIKFKDFMSKLILVENELNLVLNQFDTFGKKIKVMLDLDSMNDEDESQLECAIRDYYEYSSILKKCYDKITGITQTII
jgi:hypothetical protein